MSREISGFSIVVLGSMNPRIHHPSWYRQINVIDANAEQVALKSETTICTQQISHFNTEDFAIVCTDDRWQIEPREYDEASSVIEVVGTVFDEKLHETPINAFGLNFNFHRLVPGGDVHTKCANFFHHLGFALKSYTPTTASYASKQDNPDGTSTQLRIEPSIRSPEMVFVHTNFHCEISGGQGNFDLAPLVQQSYDANSPRASEICQQVVSAFPKPTQGDHNGT